MTQTSTRLTPAQQAAYDKGGYHFPLRAFTEEEAERIRVRFLKHAEAHKAMLEPLLPRDRAHFLIHNHFFLRWVYDIVVNPRVLDAVESVLGPDILVWACQWFPKYPGDGAFVSWHQDATYWGLTPPNVVTAWIAFSPSTVANGVMGIIPGSHREMLPQVETFGEKNMLSRGQEIAVKVDPDKAVMMELAPGEFSLHHVGIVHGSGPNKSDIPRIGLAVRYISPDVVQKGSLRDMVMLARGSDRYGHFDLVQPPDRDYAFGENPVHAESIARQRRNLGVEPKKT